MSPTSNHPPGNNLPADPPLLAAIAREFQPTPVSIAGKPHGTWRRAAEEVWELSCRLVQATDFAGAIYRCVRQGRCLTDADLQYVRERFPEQPGLSSWNRVLRHFAGIPIKYRSPTAARPPGPFPVVEMIFANVAILSITSAAIDGLCRHDVRLTFPTLDPRVDLPQQEKDDDCLNPEWDWSNPSHGLCPLKPEFPDEWDTLLAENATSLDPFRTCFLASYMRLDQGANKLRNELRLTPSYFIKIPDGASSKGDGFPPSEEQAPTADLSQLGTNQSVELPVVPQTLDAEKRPVMTVGPTDLVKRKASVSIGVQPVAEVDEYQAEFLRQLLSSGDVYLEIAMLKREIPALKDAHPYRIHAKLPPKILACLERQRKGGPWRVCSTHRP